MGNTQTTTIRDIVDTNVNNMVKNSNMASQLTAISQNLKVGGPECGAPVTFDLSGSTDLNILGQTAVVNMEMLQKMLVSADFASKLSADLKTKLDQNQTTDVIPIAKNTSSNDIFKVVKTAISNTVESENEAIQSAIVDQGNVFCANVD